MAASERLFSVPSGKLARRQLPQVLREILFHRLPFRERRTSLEKTQVIEEQLSVQVIDLVLKATREQVGRLELEWLPVAIERTHCDARGAFDVPEDLRNRQTSFFTLRRALSEDDLGIHDDNRVVLDVDHREALDATHLRRSESDALRGVHRFEHVVGQASQLVGHAIDGLRLLTEDWRTEDVNVE